jgi:uncharacterized protein (TIGR02265 family)
MADDQLGSFGMDGSAQLRPRERSEDGAPEAVPPRIHRRVIEALLEGVRDHPAARAVAARALAQAPVEELPGPWTLGEFQRLLTALAGVLSPEDPTGAGQRLAGHAFSEGWSRHPCGGVFVDSLRAFPPARAVVRLADGLRFGAEGLELEATLLGANRMRLLLRGTIAPNTAFFCGCMERMLGILGARGPQAVPEPAPDGCQQLLVSWVTQG